MRRPLGHFVVIALLLAAGVNALFQTSNEIRDPEPGSVPLACLQLAAGACALISAAGVLRRASWTQRAIGAWGAVSATMVVLLEPLTFVGAEDRGGLWQGAAVILAMAAVMIWYLRRTLRPTAFGQQPP
jgi:peptidoglycan/LPS O-acetylase OafA/YrhL